MLLVIPKLIFYGGMTWTLWWSLKCAREPFVRFLFKIFEIFEKVQDNNSFILLYFVSFWSLLYPFLSFCCFKIPRRTSGRTSSWWVRNVTVPLQKSSNSLAQIASMRTGSRLVSLRSSLPWPRIEEATAQRLGFLKMSEGCFCTSHPLCWKIWHLRKLGQLHMVIVISIHLPLKHLCSERILVASFSLVFKASWACLWFSMVFTCFR